ncbi:MAG: ABC transporter substrate-binding protein [bacterium]|nr:ABC transporter substrate-binding protein [bacterium]
MCWTTTTSGSPLRASTGTANRLTRSNKQIHRFIDRSPVLSEPVWAEWSFFHRNGRSSKRRRGSQRCGTRLAFRYNPASIPDRLHRRIDLQPNSPPRVRVGHSPDPDDAFMFYGIDCGGVDTAGFDIEQVLADIETLNRRALEGQLEVSAVSIHAYAHLADQYALMPCGASMGDGYGPCIVAREALNPADLKSKTIAVPGTLTSAFLALRLYLEQDFAFKVVPFDKILDVVEAGEADAGLIIHEGQLTYGERGLHMIVDLGIWWGERTEGLPLPLGGNVVRKDLGNEVMQKLTVVLRDSINFGLDNRAAALKYALDFGRGLDTGLTDRFVGMYVNDLTRDYGERGRQSIVRFLKEGAAAGLVPQIERLEFVDLPGGESA